MESVRNPGTRTRTRPDPKDVPFSAENGARRVSSKDKAVVIAAIASSLKAHSFPSMDVRLKNIVASQVGDLLRGGFHLEEIRSAAVELALSWDQKRGHNRLCHLSARVRAEFWADEFAEHAARMSEDRAAPAVVKIAGKPHPNFHPFRASQADRASCADCDGPIGVHVRPVSA